MAEVLAVNVVAQIRPGHNRDTAIDKQPVRGPVAAGELGLAGDTQCDTRCHGGVDKAVYAYAIEDYAWWWSQLERPLPPGMFGENLTTMGLDISGARIGEVWAIGRQVRLEVRSPRTSCGNLTKRMGIKRFHIDFDHAGRVGAYLKVLRGGEIRAGDRIRVMRRPQHSVTVTGWNAPTADQAGELLDSGIDLADDVRHRATRLAKSS